MNKQMMEWSDERCFDLSPVLSLFGFLYFRVI